jgi:large subunit ribosomal protein L17
MRHRQRARKLGRSPSHRLAMYRNLVTSLLQHERVETTDAKAKEVRRIADRMITLGKRGDLHARRRALRVLRERDVAAKVFDELAERYRTRPGGYTRVLKTRNRVGDAAAMSLVELVEPLEQSKPTGGKKRSKKKAAAKKATAKKTTTKKATAKKTAKKATRKKKSAAASD